MTDPTPAGQPPAPPEEPLLDQLLREAIPEIKLRLGDEIDRENARRVPDRYARFLPETTLVVTLRPDAARAVEPIAAELEGELTESVMRHGSLYDREYRVKLREAAAKGAPLFRVTREQVKQGEAAPPSLAERGASEASARTEFAPPPAPAPVPAPADAGRTEFAPSPAPAPRGPSVDPDATRLDWAEPVAAPGWDAGAFRLVVEDEEGNEKEGFPLPAPVVTVGRHTDNPELRTDVMLKGAPQVSRRQLALVWTPKDGAPGFRVCNLGLNSLHLEGREIPGENLKAPWRPDHLPEENTIWVAPGTSMRIGEHGPILRVVGGGGGGAPEPAVDPDATQFG